MKKRYEIKTAGIVVHVEDGTGEIVSTLKSEDDSVELGAAIDGVESLILSLACAGYNIEEPQFVEAVVSSLDALVDHFE